MGSIEDGEVTKPKRARFCSDDSDGSAKNKNNNQRARLDSTGTLFTGVHDPMDSAKILVIYTGGTIGMKDFGKGYETVPDLLESTLRQNSLFSDSQFSGSIGDPIHLPYSSKKVDHRRVLYTILEYHPLIDSCDMRASDYTRIANDIAENYRLYDGFVILHGTDTLAYTASALSFMLENLGKSVVLTGSQIPIYELRSDGRDNLLAALHIAGQYTIPEVTVFFDNNLYRGNRVSKVNSTSFHAFSSPNLPPLVETGIKIEIHWPLVWKPRKIAHFQVFSNLVANVAIIRFFPSMTVSIVRKFLEPPVQGVVLQSYGAGNIPIMSKDVLRLLKEATDRGVIIVNTTQCQRGAVLGVYATGKALLEVGVVPGGDMTPEAAIAKLMYVLGKQWTNAERIKALSTSLRGEISNDEEMDKLDTANKTLLHDLAKAFKLPTSSAASNVRDQLLPALMNAAISSGDLNTLEALGKFTGHFQVTDSFGRSPLHNAAIFGNVAATKFLLKKGCLVSAVDMENNTPLMLAVLRGKSEVIDLLLKAGAHLTTLTSHKIGADLCMLAAAGELSGIEGYRIAHANLDEGDYDNRRPLHLAAHFGQVEVFAYLLEHGCDIHALDNFGRTPVEEVHSLPEGSAKAEMLELLEKYKN